MKISGVIDKLGYAATAGLMVWVVTSDSNKPQQYPADEEADVMMGGPQVQQPNGNNGDGTGSIGEADYANAVSGNGKLSQTMAGMVGESTRDVPGTNGGRVACAYGVNTAIERATGAPALDINNGGLSVSATTAAMDSQPGRFRSVSADEAISSGRDYVITSNPDWGSTGSHIGIGSGNTVWSNSSSSGSIQQNYTASSWNNTFSTAKYYIIE